MRKHASVDLLIQALDQLEAGMGWLQRSYAQCLPIGTKAEYTAEEYDHYENLTSRYARVADLIVHKVLRSIDAVELQEPGTLIDTANRAVARGLVDSVETLRAYKDLRNDIAHEYQTEDLSELFADVMRTTPELLSLAKVILNYGHSLLAGSEDFTSR
ncbi:MAG: hypothetical protein EA428_00310 [Spirochaetaceae bacterium]|nr:MAG: hypothetical protein EA428_00310 [Spirochaetaceae bacterium]